MVKSRNRIYEFVFIGSIFLHSVPQAQCRVNIQGSMNAWFKLLERPLIGHTALIGCQYNSIRIAMQIAKYFFFNFQMNEIMHSLMTGHVSNIWNV